MSSGLVLPVEGTCSIARTSNNERALRHQLTKLSLNPVGIQVAGRLARESAWNRSASLQEQEIHLRQGRVDDGRTQLTAGMQAASTRPTDGYGALVRSGLERLQKRLQEAQCH